MIEVRVQLDVGDLAPLRRYLAMDEYTMVQSAIGYLLENPREVKDWIAQEGKPDGVYVGKAPREHLPIDPLVGRRAVEAAVFDEATGCLVSTKPVNDSGFALISWSEPGGFGYGGRRRSTPAARAAFVHHYGPIPPGRQVTQTCGNRRCVAKEHLALRSGRY